MVLGIATQKNGFLCQMGVKFAFLNGLLEEQVYVNQPLRYEIEGQEDKVYMSKKTLYSLK